MVSRELEGGGPAVLLTGQRSLLSEGPSVQSGKEPLEASGRDKPWEGM